jgi:predicted metal-dependent hydrolase
MGFFHNPYDSANSNLTLKEVEDKFVAAKEKWLQEIFTRYPDSKEQSSRVIIQVGKREIIIPIPLI